MRKKPYNKIKPVRQGKRTKAPQTKLRGMLHIPQGALYGLAFFAIAAVYVSVMNAAAVKGGSLRGLEREIAQLKERGEQLALDEARLRVSTHITDDEPFIFVKEEDIRYIAHENRDDKEQDTAHVALLR